MPACAPRLAEIESFFPVLRFLYLHRNSRHVVFGRLCDAIESAKIEGAKNGQHENHDDRAGNIHSVRANIVKLGRHGNLLVRTV